MMPRPVILGPCRCQGCGQPLEWLGKGPDHRGWVDRGTWLVHNLLTCPGKAARPSYVPLRQLH